MKSGGLGTCAARKGESTRDRDDELEMGEFKEDDGPRFELGGRGLQGK